MERFDGPEPVNIGAGREMTIKELVGTIARLSGFGGELHWDTTKPNGQPRRSLDTSRAESFFGFRAKTSFEDGLRQTVEWFRQTDGSSSRQAGDDRSGWVADETRGSTPVRR
jgi:GDP-L-fucose synthase